MNSHDRDELSKDARVIYRHNLTGGLETAVRSSNAQYENSDILSRLDVRLLEVCSSKKVKFRRYLQGTVDGMYFLLTITLMGLSRL